MRFVIYGTKNEVLGAVNLDQTLWVCTYNGFFNRDDIWLRMVQDGTITEATIYDDALITRIVEHVTMTVTCKEVKKGSNIVFRSGQLILTPDGLLGERRA